MPPLAEDLGAFFNVAHFATAATLDGQAVSGIFEMPGQALTPGGGSGMASFGPTYLLPESSLGAAAVGSSLVVTGRGSFTVAEVVPDGAGLVTLALEGA